MSTDTDITTVPVQSENNVNEKQLMEIPKKKKSGMNLLRVALFMIRRKSKGKHKPVRPNVPSQGLWKRLLGSMRPLHLQHNHESPPPAISTITADAPESPDHATIVQYEDVFPQPISPYPYAQSSPSSSVCDDNINSRYASATNLQELDKSEDSYDGEINECGEDLNIDIKAEEFIASFYEQMRNQQVELSNRRYDEMVARGLR